MITGKPHIKRQIAVWSRWLHIYLSMASFAILFFFAITGLTLNHTEWFAGQQHTRQLKGTLDKARLTRDAIVDSLRAKHAIRGVTTDFRTDDSQVAVSFKGPGYTADAFIDRATGAYDLTETNNGLFAVMNDLHKGRDSGQAWSAIIDVSAILMTLVSVSGFVLIFLLAKKRTPGLITAAIGALICVALYLRFVP